MQGVHLFLDILQGNAAYPAHRISEVFVDHLFVNADRLKNLRALIGLDRGNAHLGRNLHNAVQNRAVVIVHRRIVILIQHTIVNQLSDTLLRQIGVNRRSAEAEQRRKMVHLPWLRGF